MERVLGLGGFFFRAKDPTGLAEWYEKNLGVGRVPDSMEGTPWYQEAGYTAFQPFEMDSEMFGRPEQTWMLNFRVSDLDAMAQQLRSAGTEVEVDPTTYPMGRFASLTDPEGNPIQLWEEIREG